MSAGEPGAGRPFQDILDGYFPLRESVRQMAVRQGFGAVTLMLTQAPVMDVAGLAEDEPVPLHLREGYAGLIDTLILTGLRAADGRFRLFGGGDWRWFDARDDAALPADIRLGEPAFVQGFGWPTAPDGSRRLDALTLPGDVRTFIA